MENIRIAELMSASVSKSARASSEKESSKLIYPILSGPKSVLDLVAKKEWNGEEAQAGGDHRQAA